LCREKERRHVEKKFEKNEKEKNEEKKITLKEKEQKTHDNPLFSIFSHQSMPTNHTYKLQHPLMTVFIETCINITNSNIIHGKTVTNPLPNIFP
jgi:hypothetical protein